MTLISVDTLTTLGNFISTLAGFVTAGLLLAMGFLLFDIAGKLSKSASDLRSYTFAASILWATGEALNILATLANILGSSISGAFDSTSIRSFVTQISLGKYMMAQLCIALLIAGTILQVKRIITTNRG